MLDELVHRPWLCLVFAKGEDDKTLSDTKMEITEHEIARSRNQNCTKKVVMKKSVIKHDTFNKNVPANHVNT